MGTIISAGRGQKKVDPTPTGPAGEMLNQNIDDLVSELNGLDAADLLRLLKSANLSDLANAATARSNL